MDIRQICGSQADTWNLHGMVSQATWNASCVHLSHFLKRPYHVPVFCCYLLLPFFNWVVNEEKMLL